MVLCKDLPTVHLPFVGRDESDDKSDDFDSYRCGRTAHAVPTARDMRYGRSLEVVSAWMSQETVMGRLPSLLPGRRRLAAAGWSKGESRSMT
ncbi:hypothetical protein EVAR_53014_1 [Eumeta japonica]|uniref:Uncharacterized protein n=1 Tax=Eumeta variegata TaxID=151549 RepID=A0A4C1XQN7_EUMVA|nr:hypothetical protein EVAR_53014_1 [Eumeta japonica]